MNQNINILACVLAATILALFGCGNSDNPASSIGNSSNTSEVGYSSLHMGSSSSIVSGPFVYTDWNSCVSAGYCGTFEDVRSPGRLYKKVKIGTQTWMAENLAYLPSVQNYPEAANPRYYVYDYNGTELATAKALENYRAYGVLYNWQAAKRACPSGWHLPTPEEWSTLEASAGRDRAGTALKTKSPDWYENTGIDSFGFSGVPGGRFVSNNSMFEYMGSRGYWWTTAEYNSDKLLNPTSAIYFGLEGIRDFIVSGSAEKGNGLSVRCVLN